MLHKVVITVDSIAKNATIWSNCKLARSTESYRIALLPYKRRLFIANNALRAINMTRAMSTLLWGRSSWTPRGLTASKRSREKSSLYSISSDHVYTQELQNSWLQNQWMKFDLERGCKFISKNTENLFNILSGLIYQQFVPLSKKDILVSYFKTRKKETFHYPLP